jgi:hypothetical protein
MPDYSKLFEEVDKFVKNNLLTFYLSSCEGIPNAMWQYISNLITLSLSTCEKILPVAFLARLIYDEVQNRRKGVIDLRVHASTIFTTILIFVFFKNYKWCLEALDGLIQAFYFYVPVELNADQAADQAGKWATFIKKLKANLEIFNPSNWSTLLLAKLQEYSILAMQYFRAILLLIASIFGPIATLTYFINRNGFSSWLGSYLNLSCWGITLNVFEGIVHAHKSAAITSGTGSISFVVGSAVIAFLIFMTPTITSQFIGNAILPNLAPVVNFVSRGISYTGRAAGGLASKALSYIPGVGPIAKIAGILKRFK